MLQEAILQIMNVQEFRQGSAVCQNLCKVTLGFQQRGQGVEIRPPEFGTSDAKSWIHLGEED